MTNELPVTIRESNWGSVDADRVSKHCRGGENKSYSPQSDLPSITLCDIAYIRSDAVTNLYYHALPKNTLESPLDRWTEKFGYGDAAENVIRRLITWKQDGSGSDDAILHEKLIKDAFPVSRPVRKEDRLSQIGAHHLEDEDTFLKHLHELSLAYLKHHNPERFSVYRGCTYFLPQIAKNLFERPNRTQFQLETSVVVNFTISRDIAEQYHPLNLELDVQAGDVAIAVDHIVWDYWAPEVHEPPSDGDYRYRDGELQLFGDRAASVPIKSVHFAGASKPLAELITKIPDSEGLDHGEGSLDSFTMRDHSAIAICIRNLAKENMNIEDKGGRYRLRNWFRIVSERYAEPEFEVETWDSTVEIKLEQLADDIKSITGLPRMEPDDKLMDRFSEAQRL